MQLLMSKMYILSIIVPLICGLTSFLIKDTFSKNVKIAINLIYLSIFLLLSAFVICSFFKLDLIHGKEIYYVIGGWKKAVGIELKYNFVGALTIVCLILIECLFFIINIKSTISYAFRGFACIMLCGANGIVLTNDIFNTYVFFEVICITSYFVYSHTNKKEGMKNTFNYMILSGFASVMFLLVAGMLYQITGNLNLDKMHDAMSGVYKNKSISALYVIFILSMLFKIGIYPFHNILVKIYDSLPPRFLMLVAGVSSIVYPFFIIKFLTTLFGIDVLNNNEYLDVVLKVFGGVGFVFFSSTALLADNIKKFIISLAFAQTSFFAFCVPYLDNKYMYYGLIYSVVCHALTKVCMLGFLNKFQVAFNSVDINKTDLAQLSSKIYKYLFSIILFLTAGMPLSLVFIGKWYSLVAIFYSATSNIWLVIIILGFAIEMLGCFDFIKKILLVNKNAETISIKNDWLFISMVLFIIITLIATTFIVGSPLKMN